MKAIVTFKRFYNFQLMGASRRPAATAVRELAVHALVADEDLDYTVQNPKRDEYLFKKELDLCASLGTIDLPATTMKDFLITPFMKKLVCEGFTVTNSYVFTFALQSSIFFIYTFISDRFPDNFVLMKADNEYQAKVVWVTDFVFEDNDVEGNVTITGHSFDSMQPSWKTSTDCFARFHSYLISDLNPGTQIFKGSDLIGKGIALHMDIDVEHPRILNFEQKWVFHMLDHCLPR